MTNEYDPRSLYGCDTQLMLQTGNGQFCTIFHLPGDEQKRPFWNLQLLYVIVTAKSSKSKAAENYFSSQKSKLT